uniref:WRKY domain-containing protein n=1 Tax=Kalanchoe fedtschenkoi TaxID=63787 RepID=A0A7N0T4D1_KALFE
MEANSPAWEQQALINELKQGRELAKQLQNHLNPSTASSETRLFLVQKIISSYEKTLTKLNPSNNSSKNNNSPRSQGSSHQHYSTHQDASKKRKAMPKWIEQVQVKSETGLESPLDDGHSWRKYGQKDILGAIHPRGYYRCTHRHVQGCLATKQVQRSDQDPTIFHVTYRGQHTCTKSANSSPNKPSEQQKRRKTDHTSDQLRFSFGVKNEERSPLEEQVFPTFSSFPSTSSGNKPDDYVFMLTSAAEAETEDQFIMCAAEGSSFSPLYISSATSDTDFYPPCHVPGGLGLSHLNVQISEFEAAGSCLNFGTNSPMGVLDLDLDFPVRSATSTTAMDFDSSFPFGFLDYD